MLCDLVVMEEEEEESSMYSTISLTEFTMTTPLGETNRLSSAQGSCYSSSDDDDETVISGNIGGGGERNHYYDTTNTTQEHSYDSATAAYYSFNLRSMNKLAAMIEYKTAFAALCCCD
mmetsp:Transcript_6718/g.7421  ORF Transcript_6718/g.7421 Transcript_6718/m.7421 type:complete len:118 (+) Transcript_6718:3-356(+)